MNASNWIPGIGASVAGKQAALFKVWAPFVKNVSVEIISQNKVELVRLEKDPQGYFTGYCENISGGDRYFFALEDKTRYPDPASRFQPLGVHGPSQIIDPSDFVWNDGGWEGLPLMDFIIYELHVGTFSREGTFKAIVPHLDYLKGLGITAVELMPVAQFPGSRNWGYDGAYLFAPQNSYGGPDGLKTLIDACHEKGLAVILDVVYNHLGPEGNYLGKFGPYFSGRYKTPWGDALNFDGPYSDEVRRFFADNALYWITEYHVDALRVDAIHGIFDFSARHFLQELAEAVHKQAVALGRRVHVVAESDLNDVRFINPADAWGCGLDAQWNDDFHHSLHTLITRDDRGYYQDFGDVEHLAKAFREGFVYSGQHSEFRKRRHGNSSADRPAHQFIVFSQNHDQIGNRTSGDRPDLAESFEKLKLAAGVVILSPYIPLIFMGEEYGEEAPFHYFTSHTDEALIWAIRKGRLEEFASFGSKGEIPDPNEESTFLDSRIDLQTSSRGKHKILLDFYRTLINLRKRTPALKNLLKENMEVRKLGEKALLVRRWFASDDVSCVFNFNEKHGGITLKIPRGEWVKALDSSSKEWGRDGETMHEVIESSGNEITVPMPPHSFVVYKMQGPPGLH